MQALREDASLTELDLSERNMFRLGRLDNVSARLLAKLLLGNASLTELKYAPCCPPLAMAFPS